MRQTLCLLIMATLILGGCKSLTRQTLPPERPLPEDNQKPDDSLLTGMRIRAMLQLNKTTTDDLKLSDTLQSQYNSALTANNIALDTLSVEQQRALENEILRSNLRRGNEYLGKQPIDFYLKATLTQSGFKETYDAPVWCPFCDEKRPGTCEYEMDAELILEAYELPSVQRLKHWRISQHKTASYDANKRCGSPADGTDTKALYNKLRDDTLEVMSQCATPSLLAYISPEAYVLSYYSDGIKHYFEISAGTGAGFHSGDSVSILRPSSKAGEGATVIGEASLSSLVESKRAFIEVSDSALATQIKRYDKIKLKRRNYSLKLGCVGQVEEI